MLVSTEYTRLLSAVAIHGQAVQGGISGDAGL